MELGGDEESTIQGGPAVDEELDDWALSVFDGLFELQRVSGARR